MKGIISLIGIVLIIIGIAALAYQRISYTQQEKIAQIGNLQVTTDTEKTIYLSPIFSGLSIVAGIVLVLIGRRNGK